MKRLIVLKEFDRIYIGEKINDVIITNTDIEQLQNLKIDKSKANVEDFLNPIRKGVQFKNYVGVLKINSGLIVEILPKLYGINSDEESKKLVFTMLRDTKHVKSKLFDEIAMDKDNNSMLEIFINMFLDEVEKICKVGLVSEYQKVEENFKFLKGKLLIHKHVKVNKFNYSNFYNEYDDFILDHNLNRLIKATLIYLSKVNVSNNVNRKINNLLPFFEDINARLLDINKISPHINRRFEIYDKAIEWSKMILNNNTFNTFSGVNSSLAFLFPMERLYEEYVYNKLKYNNIDNIEIVSQQNKYSLFNKKNNEYTSIYKLKPDIVIKKNEDVIIVDTKWKILGSNGPSQMDIYQMYAYFTRYRHHGINVKKVILLYPYSGSYPRTVFQSLSEAGGTIAIIEVAFVNLTDDNWINDFWKLI
ncbi:McrC family protein [Abyssicoccus albus]|uniref:5-methylcytosine-specific restriction enzyme subunit McrC n=1 Tax=Abyssicoccus albus TaxID=1817405 RepID=A0A3N5BC49_9BACL|nr:hypothetical protein [Abyssicoccus albus]RPF55174.1 5-methylcytosine-specific restriction enzyme subunit McrC [Abyssicoccus albus]